MLLGCEGTLTEEQRRKAKKDMTDHAIKKVNEAQITESAFLLGRTITKTVESQPNSVAVLDSLQKQYLCRIALLSESRKAANEIESRLIEAYASADGNAELTDNVQRLGADSVIYTKPVVKSRPDGSTQFMYAIGVTMPKRMVVLSIKE
jgi:hypothetical protein